MNLTRQFQTLICGVLFWMTDEQVTLTAESGLNSFVCGSPETLICTTAPSPALMTWKIDNTQAATCFGKTCTPNSVFNSSYIFTFDVENGTFGLQKKKVTLLDNGTTFICQDGFTSDSVIANVIVKDDFDSFENRATTDNSTKRLEYKVTTGCLHDDIAANVIFKWYYKKVYSTDSRIEYDSSSDEQTGSNDSNCRSDSDCGVDGLTQKSSLLYITKADKGDTCTLEVDIKFGSTKTINVNFNTTFILKVTKTPLPCFAVFGITLGVLWLILIQLSLFGYWFHDNRDTKCGYWFAVYLLAHIPVIGLILQISLLCHSQEKKVQLIKIIVLIVLSCCPYFGLIVIGVLAIMLLKSEEMSGSSICKFALFFLWSLTLKTVMILTCTVFDISSLIYILYAPLCMVFWWICLVVLAEYFHEEEDTRLSDLCCTPLLGWIYYICIYCATTSDPEGEIHHSNTSVSPESKNIHDMPSTVTVGENIRELRRLPRVTSRNALESNKQEYHNPLPPIRKTTK